MKAETGYRAWLAPLGFGTAVSMWAVAYIGRLPVVMAPSMLIAGLMLVALALWGWWTGRWTGGGWSAGAAAGFVAAIINMLILGSFLSSAETTALAPSALWWIPGSLLLTAGLAAAAAQIGSVAVQADGPEWPALFSRVALGATFLLIVAGGLVTSSESGLAVVDWPNSYGYNMFLYPISKMTGGIYYEHAHRLFGSLVGLTTVALAVYLWRRDERAWIGRLAASGVALVIVQGILGGLRVTGSFTLSTSADDMAPSIALAALHGVLGQLFLGVLVILAVAVSPSWRGSESLRAEVSAQADKRLQSILVGALVIQLVLGAVQRHFAWGLVIHISMAAVVWMVASVAGARAWWLYTETPPISRLGKALVICSGVQVVLGIAALAVTAGEAVVGAPSSFAVLTATSHQACGALLLALSVALLTWTHRMAKP